jgi:hypothetical protein
MFNDLSARSGDAPPLWIELFDHRARVSVDGCICRQIDDAVAAFDELLSDAETLNEARRAEANGSQV